MTIRGLRRLAAVAILAAQLVFILRAYTTPIDVFGFQMFPESSDWSVQIFRITADGDRIALQAPWPGGYSWGNLVSGSGLEDPGTRQPAAYGIDASLHLLQGALDWVAANTPADTTTLRILAEIDLWHNGRGPEHTELSSAPRAVP